MFKFSYVVKSKSSVTTHKVSLLCTSCSFIVIYSPIINSTSIQWSNLKGEKMNVSYFEWMEIFHVSENWAVEYFIAAKTFLNDDVKWVKVSSEKCCKLPITIFFMHINRRSSAWFIHENIIFTREKSSQISLNFSCAKRSLRLEKVDWMDILNNYLIVHPSCLLPVQAKSLKAPKDFASVVGEKKTITLMARSERESS